jgi:2-methylisocitrate lyase-like PEP mutase family enzyme
MKRDEQVQRAESFRQLHRGPRLLLLANVWDPMSARIVEAAGYGAMATTSGGLAWALGYQDGEDTPWSELVAATARIVRVVRVPVSVDMEEGYGGTPQDVARNVADLIRAGAVGINLEDGTPIKDMPVRTIEDAAARIRAAREAARQEGVPLFINARIDLYLKQVGDEVTRQAETIRRAHAYLAAGADGIFPFAVIDPKVIAALTASIRAPINIVGRPGTPPVAELERLGVARVSTASGLSLQAMSLLQETASRLRETGTFETLSHSMTRAEAQALFAARP